jgi:phosphopantothenoylcysteine decarboxylase / phosphopantothenate---cysteine ligase
VNNRHDEPGPARGQRSGTGQEAPHPHLRVLITAGPTHEPIDAVRFLGNRSSGRLGVALSDEAARRGCSVTLLLGPTPRHPNDSRVEVSRFQTSSDLELLLAEHLPRHDVLIMAAAVADYRPRVPPEQLSGKLKREARGLVLELEPTRDQIALCSERRQPGQLLVGFALEPRERLLESAREKLERKRIDLIVANPLETLDAEMIEATVLGRDGSQRSTPGSIPKRDFAAWLMDIVEAEAKRAVVSVPGRAPQAAR